MANSVATKKAVRAIKMAKIVKFMAVNTSSYPKEDFHLQKNSSSYMVLHGPNDNVMVTRIIQENHPVTGG